jgi:RimJ/RimL family protein N-acetyltransferase
MPVFPNLVAPLRSETVTLRGSAERDIPEVLIAHQDDPELHVRLGYERPPSGAELGRRTEAEPAERQAGIGVRLTILDPESDTCRGQLDVHRVDWGHQRAELGIWVASRWRSRGLGTGALALAGRWLLQDCGIARVELLTEPDNLPMIRAAAAAGFHEEGVLRAYVRERDRRLDLAIMSLLSDDLEAS